jgi:hypothetical protein
MPIRSGPGIPPRAQARSQQEGAPQSLYSGAVCEMTAANVFSVSRALKKLEDLK